MTKVYLPQKWIISEFLKWIISDNQPYDCDEELICPKAKGEHVEDEVNSRAVEGPNLMNILFSSLGTQIHPNNTPLFHECNIHLRGDDILQNDSVQ